MKELAGVILIGIFVAAWMTRWEVTSPYGAAWVKHDRLTGASYWCDVSSCYEAEK